MYKRQAVIFAYLTPEQTILGLNLEDDDDDDDKVNSSFDCETINIFI